MNGHPARFSDALMPVFQRFIDELPQAKPLVLDPFAGTGRIHELKNCLTAGIEIEPEWAAMHPLTIEGDATDMPKLWTNRFDVVITSPTYGNRMADHHEARDDSKRITYRHLLGRPLHERNTGGMQWGSRYRTMHEAAWREVRRVIRPGGWFVLNIRDHIRDRERIRVTDWHITTITDLGFILGAHVHVPTPGMRFGANRESRVDGESVIFFKLPNPKDNP